MDNNNNKGEAPKENIKREDKFVIFSDNLSGQTNITNINLHASSGLKVMISISSDKSMKELFEVYMNKLGISYELLSKNEIIFIFNALTININESKSIREFFSGKSNCMTITVVDRNNVIGAKSI